MCQYGENRQQGRVYVCNCDKQMETTISNCISTMQFVKAKSTNSLKQAGISDSALNFNLITWV